MSRATERLRRARVSLRRLSPLVGRRRASVALITISSVGAGLAEAAVLTLIAYIATSMSGSAGATVFAFGPLDVDAPIPTLLIVTATLAVLRLLLQLVLAYLPARLAGSVQTQLRTGLVNSFLHASWAQKAKEKEGHLQELMGPQVSQAGSAVLMLTAGFAAGLEFLTLIASALVLSVPVSVTVIVTAALLFGALRPLSRRVRQRARATSKASIEQASGVAESVRMAEEVEVFGAAEAERSRLLALVRSLEKRSVSTRSLSRVVPVIYQSAVIFLLVGGLALLYMMGTTRLAALGAVVLILVRASAYGQHLQTAYQGFGEALPYLDRVTTAIDRYQRSARLPGDRRFGSIGSVVFDHVSFAYRPTVPVVQAMSFSIQAREAVGVIGPSGAGKSTLLQLLLRLREPSEGSYLIDGIRSGELADEDWYRKVAFLPQEPHLLNDTVAENIRFFREWIDDAAVERAAGLAHIHEDIVSWSNGYETVVGQRADAVSGGQRQRLCLARALAGSPELLLLDEPTSALDLRSERLIQESLAELRGELTLILVAHRLTTLSVCDRVMVIRDGRLESFEPVDRLYDTNEFYRQTVNLASAGGRAEG